MHIADINRPRRKPSLTPMIDVVFLLLVFFMLASRFGMDQVLPLPLAAAEGDYTGPPRLIDIAPNGISVNGVALNEADLAEHLHGLVEKTGDTLVLRGADGASLQRIVAITEILHQAGFTSLVLVE